MGEERFLGRSSEMILQDVQNQLVDDMKLNFVAADKSLVGVVIAIESNNLAIRGVHLENVRQHDAVVSVIPLRKLLALGGRNFRPVCQEINLLGGLDLHGLLADGKLVLGAVERAVSGDKNGHEEPPSEVFTLVLEELGELISGGDGYVKTNMITGGFGSNEPAFLIGLLGEIPELFKGTDNAVE